MKRVLSLIAVTAWLLCGFSCSTPLATSARNTIAALQGEILAAQTQHKVQCVANPSATSCTAINQAIAAENLLITATEAYCNWSTTNPPTNPIAPCVPVSSAAPALQTAIANANSFITELQGVL